jgi:hypothetical protein
MAFPIDDVPGLMFMPEVLTQAEETVLLQQLSAEPGHPVQQIHPAHEFGWCFAKNFSIKPLTADDYLGRMPDALQILWLMCVERARLPPPMAKVAVPDHALVNVYRPGDCCTPHVDDVNFWQDWVVGVSLGSGATLEMCCPSPMDEMIAYNSANADANANGLLVLDPGLAGAQQRHTLWLPPRSIYVLTGEARYRFTHAITAALSDTVDGKAIQRGTRTSITFRTISERILRPSLRKLSEAAAESKRDV